MDATLKSIGDKALTALPGAVLGARQAYGELTLTARPRASSMSSLSCATIRLPVFCFTTQRRRLSEREKRLKSSTNCFRRGSTSASGDNRTDETTPVRRRFRISAADWYEAKYTTSSASIRRHPDLRRILTDYGFDGHPLRKVSR